MNPPPAPPPKRGPLADDAAGQLLRRVRETLSEFGNCPCCGEVDFYPDGTTLGEHRAGCWYEELMAADLR